MEQVTFAKAIDKENNPIGIFAAHHIEILIDSVIGEKKISIPYFGWSKVNVKKDDSFSKERGEEIALNRAMSYFATGKNAQIGKNHQSFLFPKFSSKLIKPFIAFITNYSEKLRLDSNIHIRKIYNNKGLNLFLEWTPKTK